MTQFRIAAAGLLCGLAVIACDREPIPTLPSITIINTVGNNSGPSPSPSGSPGTGGGSLPEGSFIRVGIFGQNCPPGVTPPGNGNGQIKVGCTAFITATPKYADGTDIPATVHGSVIAWAYLSGNGVTADCRADTANDFNRICVGRSVGALVLQATVKNVSRVAELQVVTP